MKTVMKIVLGIVIAFILLIGGCTAIIGSAMSGGDSSPEDKAAEIIEEANSKEPAAPATKSPKPEKSEPDMTAGQANAVRSADNYLDTAAFSMKGLIKQLEFEGYSKADATFAVKAIKPDWDEQAAKSAENYLSISGFSRDGLIKQLMFEGYTREQAEYGTDKAGL